MSTKSSVSVNENEINATSVDSISVVQSFTEWDPLEEVIVGVAEHSIFPAEPRRMIEATMPDEYWDEFRPNNPYPAEIVANAAKELNELAHILESEGVTVRRPDIVNWEAIGGHTGAMPRDSMLVVGSTIIEAPMVWRSRQKELLAHRRLLQQYQQSGARWISAPRVLDPEQMLMSDQAVGEEITGHSWAINNIAPAFDAADFMRFGKDIVAQLSHVTNAAGIEWLQNYLGDEYRVHTIPFNSPHAMHIDTTITPLRAGLLAIRPEYVDVDVLRASIFSDWDLVPVPAPTAHEWPPLYMTSAWLSMNVLVIDDKRILVEAQDEQMFQFFKNLGFDPIRCPFRHVFCLGGSFHCATLDIRRQGTLQSYC